MSKNNNGNRPMDNVTEPIKKEEVKIEEPKVEEVKEEVAKVEEVKEEIKEEVKKEEVKVVDGTTINGYPVVIEDHKKEKSYEVYIEDVRSIIPLGGIKGPLSMKLPVSSIKSVLEYGHTVTTLNDDGSRFYVHVDAHGKLKIKK